MSAREAVPQSPPGASEWKSHGISRRRALSIPGIVSAAALLSACTDGRSSPKPDVTTSSPEAFIKGVENFLNGDGSKLFGETYAVRPKKDLTHREHIPVGEGTVTQRRVDFSIGGTRYEEVQIRNEATGVVEELWGTITTPKSEKKFIQVRSYLGTTWVNNTVEKPGEKPKIQQINKDDYTNWEQALADARNFFTKIKTAAQSD